ncbi:MAG: diguanylate cyclase, partial [Acidobacteriales bacterium]|nr:diguanylate cyclase [Terriglobales bacterium]
YDLGIAAGCTGLAFWNLRTHVVDGVYRGDTPNPHVRLDLGLALILLYCALYFYRYAQREHSLAFRLLAISLGFWAVLMWVGEFRNPYLQMFNSAGHLLGPVPQMLLGISMVMVLFENERNAVQENTLAFSTLDVDPSHLLSADELVPSLESVLDRLIGPFPTRRALLCVAERWRAVLPSVQCGFSPAFLAKVEASGAGDLLSDIAYRSGGFVKFRNIAFSTEALAGLPTARAEQLRQVLSEENIRNLTVVSLRTRERTFGVILLPEAERHIFGSSSLRLLAGLALQIALTFENYVALHEAQRRTKEYELLTQIGQAVSSRLNQDEVLRTVHKELGQLFDTRDFYVAFQEGDEIRFELEVDKGQIMPKRSRKIELGLIEYILRTGRPLLIRSNMEESRERIGATHAPRVRSRSYCGAPIFQGNKCVGVIAARSTEREFAFDERDLSVMQTAAGQMAVAIENARLFADEQRRARQFAFLNTISRTAISSESAEQMLADIVAEIQKNFHFDHIGIGTLDYASKEIEIKAEAGSTTRALGVRIPLGSGIVGRVARTGEAMLLERKESAVLQSVMSEARSVLAIPISYGGSLLGVLNVESRRENAFAQEDVLILNTLADLLATALHNSFVFQKLQQQSITDGLTGIKTRRFFWEALSSEWKRASRSGRPFSVILMDLDKFKEVNDTFGHLEGDLVLARVARLLEQKCRQSNVVARYGGDEFMILMPETGIEPAQILAERLRLWISTDSMLSQHQVTGSFGIASFPVHGFSVENLIRVADAGMYLSKHSGGNRVSISEEIGEGEEVAVQRQQIAGYIEGFLQREHTGPEHIEELLNAFRKLAGEGTGASEPVLRNAIESLTQAAESREINASGHGEMTAHYSHIIAHALGWSDEEVTQLEFAAKVHDVGKIFVPEAILNKEGPLTADELYVMKMHPRIGAEIVATIPSAELGPSAIEHHHEAFDGSGYPGSLRGEDIPLS